MDIILLHEHFINNTDNVYHLTNYNTNLINSSCSDSRGLRDSSHVIGLLLQNLLFKSYLVDRFNWC